MNPLSINAAGLKVIAAGILLLAALVSSYQFGRHVKTGEVAEEQRKALAEINRLQREKQAIGDRLIEENTRVRAAQASKEKLITQEVLRYEEVTPAADRCTLPGTWRVLHDAAATGMPVDPASGSLALGAAGEVEDAAVLETVAENYAAARECLDKLAGWQRRYRAIELDRGQEQP